MKTHNTYHEKTHKAIQILTENAVLHSTFLIKSNYNFMLLKTIKKFLQRWLKRHPYADFDKIETLTRTFGHLKNTTLLAAHAVCKAY